MFKHLKKLGLGIVIASMAVNISAIPAVPGTAIQANAAVKGTVSSRILNIRKSKSTKAKRVTLLHKGDKVTLLTTDSKWVQVSVKGKTGYTQGRYISTSYGTASDTDANAISGTVRTKSLAIRSKKSKSATALKKLTKGQKVKVLTTNSKWVTVKSGNVTGYALGAAIKTANGTAAKNTTKGEEVVKYALKFLGNPYVYGGSSLTHGTDCSGFTMRIFQHFGKSLPHSSSAQRHYGTRVSSLSQAKAGDLICYYGHVAIYMGHGKIVHASNPKNDICVRSNAAYRRIACIRRIVH